MTEIIHLEGVNIVCNCVEDNIIEDKEDIKEIGINGVLLYIF